MNIFFKVKKTSFKAPNTISIFFFFFEQLSDGHLLEITRFGKYSDQVWQKLIISYKRKFAKINFEIFEPGSVDGNGFANISPKTIFQTFVLTSLATRNL